MKRFLLIVAALTFAAWTLEATGAASLARGVVWYYYGSGEPPK